MKPRYLLIVSVFAYVIFNAIAITYGGVLDFSVTNFAPWHFYVAGLSSAIGFISLLVAVILLVTRRKEEAYLAWQWAAVAAVIIGNSLIQKYFIG